MLVTLDKRNVKADEEKGKNRKTADTEKLEDCVY